MKAIVTTNRKGFAQKEFDSWEKLTRFFSCLPRWQEKKLFDLNITLQPGRCSWTSFYSKVSGSTALQIINNSRILEKQAIDAFSVLVDDLNTSPSL